jgi:hypothetical protein
VPALEMQSPELYLSPTKKKKKKLLDFPRDSCLQALRTAQVCYTIKSFPTKQLFTKLGSPQLLVIELFSFTLKRWGKDQSSKVRGAQTSGGLRHRET